MLSKRKFITLSSASILATACGGAGDVSGTAKTPSVSNGLPDGMDGVGTAHAIRSGKISAVEVIDGAIKRAEAVAPQLNAIVYSYFDEAREVAQQGTFANGPFAGVPTFIKDLSDWKGHVTQKGSVGYATAKPEEKDDRLPASWRAAGVISLGKSSSPEFGLLPSAQPLSSGATRNPWDLSRDAGGSSSGAAALVAARVVPFAHGSDGGGSIRAPAATCGVFGFKPSRERLPIRPGPPRDFSIVVEHAETITVRDSIALFQIAEGDFPLGRLGNLAPLNRPIRIGLMTDAPLGTPVDPDVVAEIEKTAKLCEDLGHTVEPFRYSLDYEQLSEDFTLLWGAGATRSVNAASEFTGKEPSEDILEPWTLDLTKHYSDHQADFPQAFERLQNFQHAYETDVNAFDLILSPAMATPAKTIGELAPTIEFDTLYDRVRKYVAFTTPNNVAGAASMSVPLGVSRSGLPIGSMFSGKYGDDELLFALALQLEEAKNWHNAVPPVNALSV